jgi:hypothetical protein
MEHCIVNLTLKEWIVKIGRKESLRSGGNQWKYSGRKQAAMEE